MSREPIAMQDQQQTVARANAYRVLAEAFSPPASWPDGFPDAIRCGLDTLDGEMKTLAAEFTSAAENAFSRRQEIAVAHARLFVGPFEIAAAPWASLYLDPDQQLMGKVSRYAAKAYAEAGLAPSSENRDAPDHVSHELEFMYFLAFQEATTGDISWRERQERFWREHLGCWLPELARAMHRADCASYYTALAKLLLEFSRDEDAHLGNG